MSEKKVLPWWIEGGGEICPFCGQAYVYEMERRCLHCDSPMCPWCRIPEEPDRVCPECSLCGEEGDLL